MVFPRGGSFDSTTVPDSVWRINLDVPEEGKTVSMDGADDRWWEQTDLVKLIMASNWLTALSEDIVNLPALTVLDVSTIQSDSCNVWMVSIECAVDSFWNRTTCQLTMGSNCLTAL